MQKQILNLGLLLLLVSGCKLSAFNQESTQNTNVNTNAVSAVNTADTKADSVVFSQSEPSAQQANAVCSDPSKPCQHKEKTFDAWELSFKMPAKLRPNKPYKSAAFYAVILKTYEMGDDCDGGEYIEAVEAKRKKEQANQPGRKVFAEYQCPNMSAVSYDFDGKWSADKENIVIGNFLAVYASATKAEADRIFNEMRNKYPESMLKQMTASYEKIEQ